MGDQKGSGTAQEKVYQWQQHPSSVQRAAKLIATEIRDLTREPFVSVGRRINSSPNFDVFETGK